MPTVHDNVVRLGRQMHDIDEGNLDKERRDIMISIWSATLYC
jgi:hypothetical protein